MKIASFVPVFAGILLRLAATAAHSYTVSISGESDNRDSTLSGSVTYDEDAEVATAFSLSITLPDTTRVSFGLGDVTSFRFVFDSENEVFTDFTVESADNGSYRIDGLGSFSFELLNNDNERIDGYVIELGSVCPARNSPSLLFFGDCPK